ncbi:hypothetical protein CFC21_059606 [Triticum aestivum]|uniref:NB-ARC domain-containing protein n=3 Tax=Triticum TaxID=4564 RepID=A0A9R0TDG2_TRITD|nr:putative disease resistance RPP13-like protein 1 [Triticum aestivum]KAF7051368.1 hypothetical protein CFC21_059606 [Triticum aestivum]VAI11217.1 unnamed protein product [Triticum turgidum subsp. durum]
MPKDLVRIEGGKLLAEHNSSSTKATECGGISFFTCIPSCKKRHDIAIKIRDFNGELEKISELGAKFLKLQSMQHKAEAPLVKQMRTCHLVEPNLVGKETLHACTRLVELVLGQKKKKAYKVGITGTGGVGKTTLAQKIYNDQKIKGAFSNQAWICVSQEYSEVALLKEVLRNFGVHEEQGETVGELSSKLAEAIRGKSFFLVLDDVWQPQVWTNLLRVPLHAAATGVILVTTRHDTVAHVIGVEDVHRVELMALDVGWELLWKSMNINQENDVQNLRHIGLEIVRKCGGLPLAIKVTASVLATKAKTQNEWRKIMERSAWSMGNLPTELNGALYLSYDDLPRHLKQCFLYLILYPEDQYMYRDDLIRLWIAEGFVEEHKEQLLEDTAEEYYYELIYRNLLQPDPLRFDRSMCKMHDLLRQIAQHFSRDENYCGDPQSLQVTTLSRLRRVSVVTDKDSLMLPNVDNEKIRARTLLIHSTKKLRVENTVFKRLPCIRVLDLTGSPIKSIPDCVGSLIHLRLLDLDETAISCLPESIGSLINLQILNLQRCKALHSLPSSITQLCNLRRLGLGGTPINQVPKGIGKLEFLNDLEGFPIGGTSDGANTQDGWKLEELGHLWQLRQLDMIKLERASPSTTDSPFLRDKKYLKFLTLCCTQRKEEPNSQDISNIEDIFEQLIPPHNLEKLVIDEFFGRGYPTWLGTSIHLSSTTYLNLTNCKHCVHLPPLGQLASLKYLKIAGATAVTKIGPEFVGCGEGNPAFPKLEYLVFKEMPNWSEWSFVEEEEEEEDAVAAATEGGETETSPPMRLLPCLKRLELLGCSKLRGLP